MKFFVFPAPSQIQRICISDALFYAPLIFQMEDNRS